jgi:ABC-2 type transport system ATP-binding protein
MIRILQAELQRLLRRRTVLVSSHDLSELEQLCDWLVMIEAGRSRYQGPASEFLYGTDNGLGVRAEHEWDAGELARALTANGLTVEPAGSRLVVRHDDVTGDELAADVNRTAHRAGIVLVELSPVRTSLEDRYLALVNAGTDHPSRGASS